MKTSRPKRHRMSSPFRRKKRDTFKEDCRVFVRIKGLEPPRLSASDPKSDVATNYTISAGFEHKGSAFLLIDKFFTTFVCSKGK